MVEAAKAMEAFLAVIWCYVLVRATLLWPLAPLYPLINWWLITIVVVMTAVHTLLRPRNEQTWT